MSLRGLLLQFPDPAEERAYRADHLQEVRRFARISVFAFCVTWSLAPILLAWVRPDLLQDFLFVFLVLHTPPLLWVALAAFLDRFASSLQIGGAVLMVSASMLAVYLGHQLLRNDAVAIGAFAVIANNTFLALRLRLPFALGALLAASIGYQIWIVQDTGYNLEQSAGLSALVWAIFGNAAIGGYIQERFLRRRFRDGRVIEKQRREVEAERQRSDRLLLNILPASIAERLKRRAGPIAEEFEETTILFADLVGFTALAERTPPGQLVELLNRLFTAFDQLSARHGLEKIKTIGDAYMAAAGVPERCEDHADRAARLALAMLDGVRALNQEHGVSLALRIGLHSGRVTAGVIGESKFAYDLWGDAVNTAARLESSGETGRICISAACAERLGPGWRLQDRGQIELKGKGPVQAFFLLDAPAADDEPSPGAADPAAASEP